MPLHGMRFEYLTYFKTFLRNTPTGVKIFPNTEEKFHDIIATLKKLAYNNYYSHSGKTERPKKFIIFGLDPIPEQAVMDLLREAKLKPVLVKRMFIKKTRYNDEANFLVHFAHTDDVHLGSLRLTRDLGGTLIKWDHFKSKTPDVTVCHRCCNFGHGAEGCAMPPKCVICSKSHPMKDCPFMLDKIKNNLQKIHQSNLRCTNCKGNHTATYRECAERIKFVAARNINARKARPTAPHMLFTPTTNFPPVVQRRNTKQLMIPSPVTPAPPVWVNKQAPVNSIVYQNQLDNIPDQTKVQSASQLFSINECQSMVNEMFNALQSCTDKFQQAKVIFDLSIKYFAKFNGP